MKKCLKKRILPVLAVLVIVITATMLPISAAAPDFLTYESSNLLPYPYLHFVNEGSDTVVDGGVTYRLQNFGVVISSGVGTGSSTVASKLYFTQSLQLPAGTYTPSTGNSTLKMWCEVYYDNGTFGGTHSGTFTLSSSARLHCYVRVLRDQAVSGEVVYPMLNKGDTAYPYQPYLPYWMNYQYQQGLQVNGSQASYDAGYDAGYRLGYDEGFVAGTGFEAAFKDPMQNWSSADLTIGYYNTSVSDGEQFAKITIRSDDTAVNDQLQFFKNGKFSVLGAINKVLDDQQLTGVGYIYASSCTLTVNFAEYAMIPSLYTFSGTYPQSTSFDVSVFSNSELLGTRNVSLLGGGDVGGGSYSYAASFPSITSASANKIVVSCLGAAATSGPHVLEEYGFTLTVFGNPNQQAYVDGLRAGSQIGYADAFDAGLTEGRAEGYELGFFEGKQEGLQITELGDWRSLIVSVCEVPINTFSSLFNFEILGLDMRAAFGSILALCVVLIVVKKVLL